MFVENIEALHARLTAYIEAVYHVSDTGILDQRRELLERDGVVRQPAFIESTRQYASGDGYDALLTGGPPLLAELAKHLATRERPLLHDPPYAHQGQALRALLFDKRDIVVFTGTGSGKTECFTIPILMRLLREAATDRASFEQRAVRAIVLYPMNALVNDQLGRMRGLFGDDDVAKAFSDVAGRPAIFGQYTGRTPFPGVRQFTAETDGRRMQSFEDFYIKTVLGPAQGNPPSQDALLLLRALSARGRWPAKPDLLRWFGKGQWSNRLHPQSSDRELVARHEFYGYRAPDGHVFGAPPDVLITNYSMLEYMLMRPIERSLFDRTRAWLDAHRDQDVFLVLDEAHLYRGAQGTEVALLIRRLRERLGLAHPDREQQLRVAITSASFSAGERARTFAGDLVGRSSQSFLPISGKLALQDEGAEGDEALARALAGADLTGFYSAGDVSARLESIRPALEACRREPLSEAPQDDAALARVVHDALVNHPLRRRLVSITQKEALQIPELSERLFPNVNATSAREATEVLCALCAFAKPAPDESNLLPSRLHTFHRGLPGLWACCNADCSGRTTSAPAIIGALFSQPRETCERCGSRVFELLTCRPCGVAYLRAGCAVTEVADPTFLWGQPASIGGTPVVVPVDVLLETARADDALTRSAWLDTRTGALFNAARDGLRAVKLYAIDASRAEPITEVDGGRRFYRCGACGDDNDVERNGKTLRRSPVEDHQTEGQDPFYALVHEQLVRQPARIRRPAFLKRETPLAGRKVLIFSDGRQKAARLAAELGRAALRDSLRPLVVGGYRALPQLTLRDLYPALLIGAASAGVPLRATDERFDDELRRHVDRAREAVQAVADGEDDPLAELRACAAPAPVATLLLRVLRDKHTGLQALALARIAPGGKAKKKAVELPPLPGAPASAHDQIIKLWLGVFVEQYGCTALDADSLEDAFRWLASKQSSGGLRGFANALSAAYGDAGLRAFEQDWLPRARDLFRSDDDDEGAKQISLNASRVTVQPAGDEDIASWGRCGRCSRVQAAVLAGAACVHCMGRGTVAALERGSDAWRRFDKRKGFYRTVTLINGISSAQPLVAREHSAALTGVSGDVQSRAERHELAFQDITAPTIDGMRSPIDVLSCTTTMEVGIDIGDLSAVALRNMPPGRANYQQRAGRAGRRGNAVATVLAYADQDGHNQHFFENPRQLIKGDVPDPTLNLENPRIAQRHTNAYVLQSFLAAAVPQSDAPDARTASLFASLGTVGEFLSNATPVNLRALRVWLDDATRAELRAGIDRWLPVQIRGRSDLLDSFAEKLLAGLEQALRGDVPSDPVAGGDSEVAAQEDLDAEDSPGKSRSLLERLLYKGVLPKYAFPTDLVAFHVFEATYGMNAKTSEVRNKLRYAPQRSLALALSEYAPGRTVFIDGRLWMSGGLYSPMPGALVQAFADERYFRTCTVCGYASLSSDAAPTKTPCPSCGDPSYGEAFGSKWLRPPGFAHPVTYRPRTEPDAAQFSRPGRAVLWAPSPPADEWTSAMGGVAWHLGLSEDWEVIITNRGPRDQGFRVCRRCGAIEPSTEGRLTGEKHRGPYPNARGFSDECAGNALDTVSLGTLFHTDVLLLRFQLPPGQSVSARQPTGVFQMTAASLATAVSLAASLVLEVESGEVIAGYRSSFTADGPVEDAIEIFLYDQLAGGAGYVVELSARIDELLRATRAILRHEPWGGRTPQPPCDRACYGCLLSYRNSFEHGVLDRRLACDLLDAAMSGVPATLDERRTRAGLDAIERWLRLLGRGQILTDQPVDDGAGGTSRLPLCVRREDGFLIVPALCHPFSSEVPDDADLRARMDWGMGSSLEIIPLDHIYVARALPVAMEKLRGAIDA